MRSLRRLRRLLIDYHRVAAAICLVAGSPPRFYPQRGRRRCRVCVEFPVSAVLPVHVSCGRACAGRAWTPGEVPYVASAQELPDTSGGKNPCLPRSVSPRPCLPGGDSDTRSRAGSERKAENTRVHLQSCRGQSSTTQMHRSEAPAARRFIFKGPVFTSAVFFFFM